MYKNYPCNLQNTETPILERYIQQIFKKQAIDYTHAADCKEADKLFYIRNEIACLHTGSWSSAFRLRKEGSSGIIQGSPTGFIPLRQEFDEHDGPDTKYVVITDNDFPIATARMYPLDAHSMMIGRVVVLPEYRHMGIGTMVVNECETWAEELGFSKAVVESRENKIAFYEQMLYEVCGEAVDGETFRCVRMEKQL